MTPFFSSRLSPQNIQYTASIRSGVENRYAIATASMFFQPRSDDDCIVAISRISRFVPVAEALFFGLYFLMRC